MTTHFHLLYCSLCTVELSVVLVTRGRVALTWERPMQLCDNYSRQNKNRFLHWYCAWRVSIGLHKTIGLNFMIAGQANQICRKRAFRRHTPVVTEGALDNISEDNVDAPQVQSQLCPLQATPRDHEPTTLLVRCPTPSHGLLTRQNHHCSCTRARRPLC